MRDVSTGASALDDQPPARAAHIPTLPLLWALGYLVLFGSVFSSVSWSFIDTYGHMERASAATWSEAVSNAFGSGVEYRPLFVLAIKASYEAFGPQLWLYQGLVLVQFAAVLALVLWICRPLGPRRNVAACIALSCVCGLHTTRILFSFWPLNHHSAVMLLVLVAAALALHPRFRAIDWMLGPVTLVGLLGLELASLIVPVAVCLWLARAPGVGGRGVASVLAATVLYVTIRLTFGSESAAPSVYAESGFIFSRLDQDSLRGIFGDVPWPFWIYNVASTFLSVAFSEPREGVFAFVESVLARDLEPWNWFHVGTSSLTTLAIVIGITRIRPVTGRDRLLVVTGLTLMLFGSALGFLYTRDRIGLSVGLGYALLLYVAVAALLDRMPPAGWRRGVTIAAVAVVACLWMIRSGELYFQLRDTAWDYHNEWAERYAELGGPSRPSTEALDKVREDSFNATPADPRLDPAWSYLLFERRFRRAASDE